MGRPSVVDETLPEMKNSDGVSVEGVVAITRKIVRIATVNAMRAAWVSVIFSITAAPHTTCRTEISPLWFTSFVPLCPLIFQM